MLTYLLTLVHNYYPEHNLPPEVYSSLCAVSYELGIIVSYVLGFLVSKKFT
jgi:hypothetical protein